MSRPGQTVLHPGHPQAGEQVLLLPRHQARPAHHLASQAGLQLADIVVDILLQPGVPVLLQSLPVGLLEKIFLNISHFLKI